MKKGEDFLDMLGEEVGSKFMNNVRNLRPDLYNNMLFSEYEDMYDFITRGFPWMATPEGRGYWASLANSQLKLE